jgi:hypothetical protein
VPSEIKQRILVVVVVLMFLPGGYLLSQSLNYREIFGNDWDKAGLFISQNRSLIESKCRKFQVSYPVAVAVIFPELVRYSALRDKIEITLLKTLYINLGEEYANFSIGHLQMKPSFADRIRQNSANLKDKKINRLFKMKSDFGDILNYRTSIVSDLESLETQLNYLVAFIKICENKFDLASMDEDTRVRFLSTAYNYGFWYRSDQIEKMDGEKYFRTTILKTDNYSYSDVSLFWYHNYLSEKKKTGFQVG